MDDTVAAEKFLKCCNLFLVRGRALYLNVILYHTLFKSYVTYQSLKNSCPKIKCSSAIRNTLFCEIESLSSRLSDSFI